MPLSFPLSYADFLGALPIKSMTLECPEVVQASETAGNEVLTDAIGARYWQGEVVLGKMRRSEKQEVETLIDAVRGAGASFMVHDVTRPYPKEDPTGAIVSGLSPQIATLPADKRLIALKGLPNYTLRRGDFLSFAYESDPVRYALHRVVDLTVTTQGLGLSDTFEVIPPLAPGAAVNATVTLIRAACKAIIVPGSVQPGRTNRFITDGMSFRFMQTRR